RLYSTYLGGSGDDVGQGIAVDGAGSAYVTGNTVSINFPTTNPMQAGFGGGSDAFVTKLDITGSTRLYSSFLGGPGNEFAGGIAVDGAGNAYVTGWTNSIDFPTTNPMQASLAGGSDAFFTKLTSTGSVRLYSTYVGGSGDDFGQGIAVDGAGNAYITGYAYSTNFPIANPLQAIGGGGNPDAFVLSISGAAPTA